MNTQGYKKDELEANKENVMSLVNIVSKCPSEKSHASVIPGEVDKFMFIAS